MANMDSQSRAEAYTAYWDGQNVILPKAPQSEIETYLAKINGQNVQLPKGGPTSRMAAYLAHIAMNSGDDNSVVYATKIDEINGEVI